MAPKSAASRQRGTSPGQVAGSAARAASPGNRQKGNLAPRWKRTEELRASRKGRVLLPSAPRIEDAGLRAIEGHKYTAGPWSGLDHILCARVWTPICEALPKWVAPNAVTIFGAMCAVSSGLLMMVSTAGLTQPAPMWAELACAGLIIVYCAADCVDGLQARRTGAASPLGELMDHGCDCVSLTWLTVGYVASLQFGFSFATFFALVASWLPWALAQWEAYHTGIVHTGNVYFGVTEMEFTLAAVHVVSAVAGPEFWLREYPAIGGFTPRHVTMGIQSSMALFMGTCTVARVWAHCADAKAVAAAARCASPLLFLMVTVLLWAWALPATLHRGLFFVAATAVYKRVTAELIVVHMTHEEYPKLQPTMLALPVVLILGCAGLLEGSLGWALLAMYTVWCAVDAAVYIVDCVLEVSTHLGVSVLFVRPRLPM